MSRFLNLLKIHFIITWADKRGAVTTHGGNLPDSAQKTDFYSIIDNATVTSIIDADISNGANIQDSKLATISTAGKVNTSALTGQIANANIAQITTPALVTGVALTLLPNIPSGAGIIPAANIGALLGTRTTKTPGQIYQAATDGDVTAWGLNVGSTCQIEGLTDSSATPSTTVIIDEGGSSQYGSVSFSVKKNDYYEVTLSSSTSSAMYFIPSGS